MRIPPAANVTNYNEQGLKSNNQDVKCLLSILSKLPGTRTVLLSPSKFSI